jgi:SAM-dependent methyltransferase
MSLPPAAVGAGYGSDWLDRYDGVTGKDAAILAAEMAAVDAWFDREVGHRIGRRARHLDLGTCTGRYLRWALARGFASVHGVDRSADAVARCSARLTGRPARLHRADFLDVRALEAVAEQYGPFDLVTMMLGTVNHLTIGHQCQVVRSAAPALRPTGHLVISSWRPGSCTLSLYSSAEQQCLGNAGLARDLDADRVGALGLELASCRFTPWHEIRVYRPVR